MRPIPIMVTATTGPARMCDMRSIIPVTTSHKWPSTNAHSRHNSLMPCICNQDILKLPAVLEASNDKTHMHRQLARTLHCDTKGQRPHATHHNHHVGMPANPPHTTGSYKLQTLVVNSTDKTKTAGNDAAQDVKHTSAQDGANVS